MHWRYQKLNYDILIPKLEKSISELSEKEAALYFTWFMNAVPERVAYVSKICVKELKISEERMDFSPESLQLLWKWFLWRAKTEPMRNEDKKSAPAGIILKHQRQLTLETEYIVRDIGMYLGETFRKNNPNLYWTYYTVPRQDFFVNHPLLKGFIDRSFGQPFEAAFEPIHMARVQAVKVISKTSKEADLLNLYSLWATKI